MFVHRIVIDGLDELRVIAMPHVYRKKKSIHKAEAIRIRELTLSSLLGAFPRCQQSKRSLKKKNESAGQNSGIFRHSIVHKLEFC